MLQEPLDSPGARLYMGPSANLHILLRRRPLSIPLPEEGARRFWQTQYDGEQGASSKKLGSARLEAPGAGRRSGT